MSCNLAYQHTAPLAQHGLTDVHVAYNAVWIGTENGRLLRCPLESLSNNDYFACSEFDEIKWLMIPPSMPTIHNIDTRNDGFSYASLKGRGRNDLWKCNPNMDKSCRTEVKLPEETQSFIILN